MDIRFEQGVFDDACKVRTQVFVEEQGFSEEFDGIDKNASTIHITAYLNDRLAGCSRVFPDPDHPDQTGRWIFGRMAVLPEFRKEGLGAQVLSISEEFARQAGATEIHLHAQCRVSGFYAKSGYSEYGPVEFDEHVEHIWMKKLL